MGGIGLIELLIIAAMVGVPLLIVVVIVLIVASRRPKSEASSPCTRCGEPVPARAKFCPHCGQPPA